jgi:hypothetical protein
LLAPEVRSALVEGLETRLKEADVTMTSPMTAATTAVKLRKPELLYAVRELELPKRRRRRIIPLIPPILQVEPPRDIEPWVSTPEIPERTPQYEVPTVPMSTTPTTADVPPPPTYTPVTVPKISEVPAVDVPTVPTYDTPTYDTYPTPQPEPLPPGWWRLLPPDAVASGSEGAYKVQAGKKQILALA